MKLLDKQEVNKAKAQDRKREVDEGAKLARQVDALRAVTAKEQANLTKFREESLKTLRVEISDLAAKKLLLETNIVELEEERTKLLQPLDQKKAQIDANRKQLEELTQHLQEEQARLEQNKKDHSKRNEELTLEESRIEDIKAEIGHKLALADSLHRDSERVFEEIKGKAVSWSLEQEKRSQDLGNLEKEALYVKTDLENRENQIKAEKQEIFRERLRLVDERKTLERAFKRLKKWQ